jgi:hypothetical protein
MFQLTNSLCLLIALLLVGCKNDQPVAAPHKTDKVQGETLSADETTRVQEFMDKVIRAFNSADVVALEDLSHPGDDPRGRANSIEFNKSLIAGGDRVKSWSARPYSDPDWDIMKHMRFHPPPTVWIDVILNDGKRDYPLAFACSPDDNGVLRTCYYVDR